MKSRLIFLISVLVVTLFNIVLAQDQPNTGVNQQIPDFCRGYPNLPPVYILFCSTYFQQQPVGGQRLAVGGQPSQPQSPEVFYREIQTGTKPVCAGRYRDGFEAITNCIQYFINRLKPLAAILLVLAVTMSGAYLIFSPASPDKAQLAWKVFFWAVVGFIIVFSVDLLRGIIREISGLR